MARDDRVLSTSRWLSAVIVPFLAVAFVVLYLFPARTAELFAWTITPTMTPMMLGGVYLGGAYFFVQAYRATQWHTIKAGFVAVTAFASLMGVATVIHWDRFNHGHVAFWLWSGLYFTTPFLVAAVAINNGRTEPPVDPASAQLPAGALAAIGALGVSAVFVGLFLFLWPSQAIELWPWALTPLTSRVLGAVFMLGLAGLGVSFDRRWSAARLMLQVASFMLALILIAAARARAEFDTSNPLTWMLLGGFAGALVGSLALSRVMDGRAQHTPDPVVSPSP